MMKFSKCSKCSSDDPGWCTSSRITHNFLNFSNILIIKDSTAFFVSRKSRFIWRKAIFAENGVTFATRSSVNFFSIHFFQKIYVYSRFPCYIDISWHPIWLKMAHSQLFSQVLFLIKFSTQPNFQPKLEKWQSPNMIFHVFRGFLLINSLSNRCKLSYYML